MNATSIEKNRKFKLSKLKGIQLMLRVAFKMGNMLGKDFHEDDQIEITQRYRASLLLKDIMLIKIFGFMQ